MLVDYQMTFIKNEDMQWGVNLRIKNQQQNYEGLNIYLYLTISSFEENQIFRKRINLDYPEDNN